MGEWSVFLQALWSRAHQYKTTWENNVPETQATCELISAIYKKNSKKHGISLSNNIHHLVWLRSVAYHRCPLYVSVPAKSHWCSVLSTGNKCPWKRVSTDTGVWRIICLRLITVEWSTLHVGATVSGLESWTDNIQLFRAPWLKM